MKFMQDKRGRFEVGIVFAMIFVMIAMTSFSFIEPLRESLNTIRGGDNLNCQGVSDFNQTAFDEQSELARNTNRPTCFVTGLTIIYLIGSVLIFGVIWVVDNWRKRR